MPRSVTSLFIAPFMLFSAAILSTEAVGEDPAAKKDVPSEARIRELVSQLGADDFPTREAAVKQLRTIGEQLLFKPELRDVEDLSNLDRFHDCFIVPLDNARKSDDIEVRQRARKLFSEFSPEHPIGRGPDGWALSAIYRLIHDVPKPLSYQDFKNRGIRRPPLTAREQREIDRKRRLLHEKFARMRIRKMAIDNPERTASLILAEELDVPLQVALMNVWPDDYPLDEAIRLLKRFDMGVFRYGAGMMNQIRRWAREDADAARQWAESLESRNHRNIAVSLIIPALAEQDLKRAEQEISKLRDQRLRDIARTTLVEVLERRGIIAKPVLIDSIKNSELRSMAQAASVRVLAKTDHRAAMKAMENLDVPRVPWRCFGPIAKRWYSVDPQGCLAYIERIEHDSTHDQWIGATGITRRAQDIDDVKELPLRKASFRKQVVISIAHEISKTDAPSALKLISEYSGVDQRSSEFGRGYSLGPILQNWAKEDPLNALGWLTSHPGYVQRFPVVAERLVREWARRQPLRACRWIVSRRDSEASLRNFKGFAEAVMATRIAEATSTENEVRSYRRKIWIMLKRTNLIGLLRRLCKELKRKPKSRTLGVEVLEDRILLTGEVFKSLADDDNDKPFFVMAVEGVTGTIWLKNQQATTESPGPTNPVTFTNPGSYTIDFKIRPMTVGDHVTVAETYVHDSAQPTFNLHTAKYEVDELNIRGSDPSLTVTNGKFINTGATRLGGISPVGEAIKGSLILQVMGTEFEVVSDDDGDIYVRDGQLAVQTGTTLTTNGSDVRVAITGSGEFIVDGGIVSAAGDGDSGDIIVGTGGWGYADFGGATTQVTSAFGVIGEDVWGQVAVHDGATWQQTLKLLVGVADAEEPEANPYGVLSVSTGGHVDSKLGALVEVGDVFIINESSTWDIEKGLVIRDAGFVDVSQQGHLNVKSGTAEGYLFVGSDPPAPDPDDPFPAPPEPSAPGNPVLSINAGGVVTVENDGSSTMAGNVVISERGTVEVAGTSSTLQTEAVVVQHENAQLRVMDSGLVKTVNAAEKIEVKAGTVTVDSAGEIQADGALEVTETGTMIISGSAAAPGKVTSKSGLVDGTDARVEVRGTGSQWGFPLAHSALN